MARRVARPLDAAACRRHRRRNQIQSLILLAGIIGIFGVLAVLVFGWIGGGVIALTWAVILAVSPRISPRLILSLYRARPLSIEEFPAGYDVLGQLVKRADLPRMPAIYYVPSATLNSFAVGHKEDAIIAFTDGMIRTLSLREFAGVLAHEVSHIRNGDLWLMNLADSISRLTTVMAHAGIFAFIFFFPLFVLGQVDASILLLPLFLFAPTVATLLQLALSRTREYDADLDAAGLKGDPRGLASALDKLEHVQAGAWERIFMRGRNIPVPSPLRSHPLTQDRIRRLLSLEPDGIDRNLPKRTLVLPDRFRIARDKPRWRLTGLWY